MPLTDEAARRRGRGFWWLAVVPGLGLVAWLAVLFSGAELPVWVLFWALIGGFVLFDVCLVVRTASGSSTRRIVASVGVGIAAALAQAGWVYASIWRSVEGGDSAWWALPLMALVVSVGLLVRRASRRFGWALLIGSAQGWVAMWAFVLALLIACDCWD